jgi:hypothetical protein
MATFDEINTRVIRMSGTLSGSNYKILPVNQADALTISDGTNNFLQFTTTTGSLTTSLLQNTTFSNYLEFTGINAPANPAANLGRLYKKTTPDLGLYWKPEGAGTEYNLTVGSELDFQQNNQTTSNTTTSTTFVNFAPTASSLTTSSTRSKQYLVIFCGSFTTTSGTAAVFTRILVNGVEATASQKTVNSGTAGQYYTLSSTVLTASIGTGIVISAQWRTTAGTATCLNRQLTIYGIG